MSETGLQAGGAAAVEVRPKGDDAVDANGGTRARGAPERRCPCRRNNRGRVRKGVLPACLPPRPRQHWRGLACYMQALWRLGVAVSGAHPLPRGVCPRLAPVPFALAAPFLAARACYRLTCCACLPQPFVFPQHCPDRRRLLGLTPGCYRCRCVCAFAHRPSHPSISIDHPVTLSLSPPPPLSSRVCVYAVLRSRRGEVG
jgi:hypothetical protein